MWGCSIQGAKLYICLCWTGRHICWPISPVCQSPAEWKPCPWVYQSLPSIWYNPYVSLADIYLPWQGTYYAIVCGMLSFSTADTILGSVLWDGPCCCNSLYFCHTELSLLLALWLSRCDTETRFPFTDLRHKLWSAAVLPWRHCLVPQAGLHKTPHSAATLPAPSPAAVVLAQCSAVTVEWGQGAISNLK